MKPYNVFLGASFNLLLPGSHCCRVHIGHFLMPCFLAGEQPLPSAVWGIARPTGECGGLCRPVRPPPALSLVPSDLLDTPNLVSVGLPNAEGTLPRPGDHAGRFAEVTSFYSTKGRVSAPWSAGMRRLRWEVCSPQ